MADTDRPATSDLERRLATILSADVAGYSRLMAEDEEQTLRIFRGHSEVFNKLVTLHRGRVFNTAGDAILAEFGSAVIIGLGKDPWGSSFAVLFGGFFLLAIWLLRRGRVGAGAVFAGILCLFEV